MMSDLSAPETKRFSGNYLLYRKKGHSLGALPRQGAHPPRKRHPTFEAARAEAARLLTLFPESTFIVIQEVARVKLKPAVGGDG